MSSTNKPLPTHFISHGHGPWPWMMGSPEHKKHEKLEKSLRSLVPTIGEQPKAIIVISAHWQESSFTVLASPKSSLTYDYVGFPAHTYAIEYNTPYDQQIIKRVTTQMIECGIPISFDQNRGFDHGVYTPLAVMFPWANIPTIQISLNSKFDAEAHLNLGKALAPLRHEGVLIVGSGMSFHNLALDSDSALRHSIIFDDWLEGCLRRSPAERWQRLCDWRCAVSARTAHPTPEHFMPLLVALGAASEDGVAKTYSETDFHNHITLSGYQFG
jgi:aromatic ring-opening dioxygenase catalytic subunit (LigB family)